MRSDAQTTAKPIASAEEVLAAAGRAASLGLRSTSLPKMPEKPIQAKKESGPIDEEDLDDSVCGVCFNGDSVQGNEILFCEKCEVPIHLVSNPPLLHLQF